MADIRIPEEHYRKHRTEQSHDGARAADDHGKHTFTHTRTQGINNNKTVQSVHGLAMSEDKRYIL